MSDNMEKKVVCPKCGRSRPNEKAMDKISPTMIPVHLAQTGS